ncbi:hypothetical protein [Clostridium paraputrificum]|uniref:hypothetical protein n=1 Tax=Clostridium paraputrificum TaxID=29363 RepID=UPI0018A1157D|nr:hypothetical protein [Clostridium paraputrificum]
MESKVSELIQLFEKSNENFLRKDIKLLDIGLCERCMCGSLAIRLHDIFMCKSKYNKYYVDIEYNRQGLGDPKIIDEFGGRIFTDIIVHSRGELPDCDNLIAIEMKIKENSDNVKNSLDRKRLMLMTGENRSNGTVSGYQLGVFYEIDRREKTILIEYFSRGEVIDKNIISCHF